MQLFQPTDTQHQVEQLADQVAKLQEHNALLEARIALLEGKQTPEPVSRPPAIPRPVSQADDREVERLVALYKSGITSPPTMATMGTAEYLARHEFLNQRAQIRSFIRNDRIDELDLALRGGWSREALPTEVLTVLDRIVGRERGHWRTRSAAPTTGAGHADPGGGGDRMTMLQERLLPSTIPLARNFDDNKLRQLKATDSDPLEVLVKIGVGPGSHGFYGSDAIKGLADHVQANTLPGYLGHVRGEDLAHVFTYPAVHWIGALWHPVKQAGYFRGVIDQREPDLKRLIRTGRITAPSVLYANPRTETRNGRKEIVSFAPISLDWAPLGREGMASAAVVSWGEQRSTQGVRDELHGEVLPAPGLRQSWRDVLTGNRVEVSGELASTSSRQTTPSSSSTSALRPREKAI